MTEQDLSACNKFISEKMERTGEVPTMGDIWQAAIFYEREKVEVKLGLNTPMFDTASKLHIEARDANLKIKDLEEKLAEANARHTDINVALAMKLSFAVEILEMVEDHRKMPHQHYDPVTKLYCLTERAREALGKINAVGNK
jgi:hypothetical protein